MWVIVFENCNTQIILDILKYKLFGRILLIISPSPLLYPYERGPARAGVQGQNSYRPARPATGVQCSFSSLSLSVSCRWLRDAVGLSQS
jgi:hypothetical protein